MEVNSLCQLDANLIEGEPYNRFAQKILQRRLKWRVQIQTNKETWETGSKNPPRPTASVRSPVQCHQHTDFFRAHPPTCGSKNVTR